MDIETLALAKGYTNKQIKKLSVNGIKGDKGDPGKDAVIDTTLSNSGEAADAKVVGNEISSLKEDLNKLVVKAESKNLFDNSDLLENTRASVNDRQVTGCLSSNWIDVEQNETYVLSNKEIIATTAFAIGYLNDSGDFLGDSNVYNLSTNKDITITIPSGYTKVRFGPYSNKNASKIEKCQFEKGSVATGYVPFGYACSPNDSFFKNYKSAFDSIYNGNGYSVGNILAIKSIEDGKPVEFEYVEEKESADNSMITEHGKNMYNYKNDTFGKYADETGGSTLKLRRSEFIPVESDTDYFITGSLEVSFNIKFAEFSENTVDSLIQCATIRIPSLGTAENAKVMGVKITTSSTTKYIRFSVTSEVNNDKLKDFMIIKGAYGIEYEPYYEFAKYDPLHPANPWRGKRLWVDGDSITHAYQSNFWQFNVAKALDMILDTSVVGLGVEGYADGWKGIGGSTISNEAGNNDPEHSIVLRYMNYPDSGIDLVIIAAGTNDWGHGHTLLGDFDSLDNTTFNGALNILLPALKEKYPTIPVVMMTPIKRGVYKADNTLGLKLEDFVDALIVKCRQYGIYCCDMYANCPIDPNITSMQNVLFTRTSANGSKDLVHPGPEGHKVMGRTVTGFIRSIS